MTRSSAQYCILALKNFNSGLSTINPLTSYSVLNAFGVGLHKTIITKYNTSKRTSYILNIFSVNKIIWSPPLWSRRYQARLSHSTPGFDTRSGQFPGWDFFGDFLHLLDKYLEASGPQSPRISFGPHNHPFIFTLFEWMCVCLVCIAFHVCVVSEVALALSWSLIRGGTPWPCVVKEVGRPIWSIGCGSIRPGMREGRLKLR